MQRIVYAAAFLLAMMLNAMAADPQLCQLPLNIIAVDPVPGTGNFIDKKAAAKAQPPTQTQAGPGEVTLNFEGADIRDVVKVVFETLKENYTVDPQVQGEVTVQTSRPLAKEALLPTLVTMLRMSNAVLVRDGGIYRIIPAAGAVQKGSLVPRLGGGKVGYGVRIVPLRYVSAAEMQAIIAPFLPEGGILRRITPAIC